MFVCLGVRYVCLCAPVSACVLCIEAQGGW